MHNSRRGLGGVVKYKYKCSALFGAGRGEMHRRTAWHNDLLSACAPNLLSLWSLQACFPR
jgi:hypothetical protein